MHGTVRKWGNSAAIRLPAAVLEAAHLEINQPVDVREEDGRIIIQPIRPAALALENLAAAITDENRHDEMDLGPMTGREIW